MVSNVENSTGSFQDIVGRVVENDTKFRRRMRLHQSWWRESKGFEQGCDKNGRLGSLLSEKDAEAGKNFLTTSIAALAVRSAKRPHVESKRLMGNLLSSQPMAFNLFGPLCLDPELARVLIGALLGKELFVASVEIEVTPKEKGNHLDDETSFDALIRYVDKSGKAGLLPVETKLTEPFSPVSADTKADREIYRKVAEESGFYRDPKSPELAKSKCWQMWRNHLLAVKYRENHCPEGTEIQAWVIRHQDDETGGQSIDCYRKQLKNAERDFREFTLHDLVTVWDNVAVRDNVVLDPYREWLSGFRERYICLQGSAYLAAEAGW